MERRGNKENRAARREMDAIVPRSRRRIAASPTASSRGLSSLSPLEASVRSPEDIGSPGYEGRYDYPEATATSYCRCQRTIATATIGLL